MSALQPSTSGLRPATRTLAQARQDKAVIDHLAVTNASAARLLSDAARVLASIAIAEELDDDAIAAAQGWFARTGLRLAAFAEVE